MTDAMKGKRGLIMGVANDRSIAWGVAKAMHEAGAELAFSYQGEAFGKRVEPLAASVRRLLGRPGSASQWARTGPERQSETEFA